MSVVIRALAAHDLDAYKALRDEMLEAHPDAFTSDAATERRKPSRAYRERLGLDGAPGGRFVIGAFAEGRLVGAIACDRDMRPKVRHTAQLLGMMVRAPWQGRGVGRVLLDACVERARAEGVETLTLSVTAGNARAEGLYERAGFRRYGLLADAVREGGRSHDKALMVLRLETR